MSVRWSASTVTDQGPRRHMTDAAEVAARRAARAATTGGTAYGIAAARAELQYFYDGAPRGQEGDRVMVTAVPMADRTGGGFDIAWVADCRAYVVQDGTLRQITEDHTGMRPQ